MRCRFGLPRIGLAGLALVPTTPTDPTDQQITPHPEVIGEAGNDVLGGDGNDRRNGGADDNLNGGDVTPDSTLSFLSDFI